MLQRKLVIRSLLLASILGATPLAAQEEPVQERLNYAQLVELAEGAELVVRAEVQRQIALKPERAPDVAPGYVRLYIEAETLALISGSAPLGAQLKYLVDVPFDARGKVPKFKKQQVLLFARSVPGRPSELQLSGESSQFLYSPNFESRLRPVLSDLAAPDSPPIITGVRDALSVAGNLTGESETQIFLDTQDGSPVSITVLRRPGRPTAWGVSWGEIIDQSALPPAPESLEWYRLACALPARLPSEANLSQDSAARTQAERDYQHVMGALGPCARG